MAQSSFKGAVHRDVVSGARPTAADRSTKAEAGGNAGPLQHIDLVIAVAIALGGALAFTSLPGGSPLRVVLAAGVLFFAPGYLLLQALPIPHITRWSRATHAFLAVGISPAIVGLLALGTAMIPGGFRPGPIVAVVTLACLGFAGVAWYRRAALHAHDRPQGNPHKVAEERGTPRPGPTE